MAERKKCDGARDYAGEFSKLLECADHCKTDASMFVYGIEGTIGCNSKGCECYCEIGASADGTCGQVEMPWYHLYRFIQKGDLL